MTAIVLDVETTGLDTSTAQIIELCIMDYADAIPRKWRFRPSIPIEEGASAVHGIFAEDLTGCPEFQDVAPEIWAILQECSSIIGYNVLFDLEMLGSELSRAGLPIKLSQKPIIDPFLLWKQMEARSLESAHLRFVGTELSGSHDAEVDVVGTANVLDAMQSTWGLLGASWKELASICAPDKEKWVGMTNHFQWNADGEAVFGFGKHRDELVSSQSRYIQWMLTGSFPADVQRICRLALNGPLTRQGLEAE